MIDALLGAGGGGDIGTMFPDDDERGRGADSIDLLRTVVGTIAGPIVNVDATLICEQPAPRPLQGGDGADARRRDLGPGQRQGDEQRGHGLDRPRRGHRLHRRGLGAERIVFAGRWGISSDSVAELRASVADSIFEVKVLHEAGIVAPMRPDKALKIGSTFLRWGASPATGIATAAIHHPHEIAIIDERGSLSFERLHRRSNALAHSFAAMGIGHGDGVGIMCRNHRGFVEATLAAAKLGASALYLNTMFAGPQLVEVTRREGPKALVYDEEFADLLDGRRRLGRPASSPGRRRRGAGRATTLEQLIAAGDESDLKPPPDKPRFVILTSGTTGTPKGAQRSSPDGLLAIAALLDKIPFRSRETMMIAAPLFHSWGFFHFVMSLPTASTMVLRRRFDPEETLRAVAATAAPRCWRRCR